MPEQAKSKSVNSDITAAHAYMVKLSDSSFTQVNADRAEIAPGGALGFYIANELIFAVSSDGYVHMHRIA